jgi:hypothetical protein
METQIESVKFNTRISYKETKHFGCTERVFESSKFSAHSSSAETLSHFCHWLASSNGKNPSGFQRS